MRQIKNIQNINWPALQAFLLTTETEPEGLIHELAHAYDCLGPNVFIHGQIGNREKVNDLLHIKYHATSLICTEEAEEAEIYASALTYIVLESLGQANIAQICNVLYNSVHKFNTINIRAKFFEYILESEKAHKDAENFLKFLVKFTK